MLNIDASLFLVLRPVGKLSARSHKLLNSKENPGPDFLLVLHSYQQACCVGGCVQLGLIHLELVGPPMSQRGPSPLREAPRRAAQTGDGCIWRASDFRGVKELIGFH